MKIPVSCGRQVATGVIVVAFLLLTVPVQADENSRAVGLTLLSWGDQTQIIPGPQDGGRPILCGDDIVWYGPADHDWDIFSYDIPTGAVTALSTGSEDWVPVAGDRIAWIERDKTGKAWLIDPVANEKHLVPSRIGREDYPVISGDILVYEDGKNGSRGISLYEIGKGTDRFLGNGDMRHPWISGSLVVWEDRRNGNPDIYLYDLEAGTETAICTDPGDQGHPVTDGQRIIWSDRRNGDADIYLYDLENRTERAICTGPGDQTAPSISGGRALWTDTRWSRANLALLSLDRMPGESRATEGYSVGAEPLSPEEEHSGLIKSREYAFYALAVPEASRAISISLTWETENDSLLLLIAGSDGSFFRFRDRDDGLIDGAIRMKITRRQGVAPGTWTSAIYGEKVGKAAAYDYAWHLSAS